MRDLTCLSLLMGTAMIAAGCGPGGPPSLEGFGDVGETEDPTTGDGDGDDPGDGDGDGDGDLGDCIEMNFGSDEMIYLDDHLGPQLSNDHDGMCGSNPGPDYSIAWRAPQSASYRAELYAGWGGWLTVLRGGCDGSLENCGALGFPTYVDFDTVAGQDYTFVIDSEYAEAEGDFTFTLAPVPVSTQCPTSEIFDVPALVGGSTVGSENGFGSSCGGQDAPDNSFVFYPPITGTYRIDTQGSGFDTILHVFDDYCGGNEVVCDDDIDIATTSEVYVDMTAGFLYTIVVDGYGASSGDYQLNLELTDAPSLCDNAEVLPSVVPTGATWSSDQDTGNLFQQCTFAAFERRFVWYPPADGLYQVSQDSGATFGGVAAVLGGCAGDGVMCQLGVEPILFDALAGQEIVFVSEWDFGDPTDITLLVEAVGAMPGCGIELPSDLPVQVSGTTSGAGNDYDGSCMVNPASEVEYWWTPPATGTYLISLEGSAYDTMLYVRQGGCDGPELGCNDDTFDGQQVYLWSSLQLDLTAGQTISIFVDGYSGSGPYDLSITAI